MPHISVKMWPGKPEEKKLMLAREIARITMEILEVPESSISVCMREVPREIWGESVYKPEILDAPEDVVIPPGYRPEGY